MQSEVTRAIDAEDSLCCTHPYQRELRRLARLVLARPDRRRSQRHAEERPSWPAIRWSIESPQRHEEECLRDMKKSFSETERL